MNYIAPEAVVLMASDANGHAQARLLTEHPRFERWNKTLTSGEMWPYFGEKWVTDPTNAAETR